MTHSILEVTNGPAKDHLLRAVANTDDQLTTLLDTPAGLLETRIGRLEELGDDGVTFTLWGQLTSLELRGAHFTASYNWASQGRLALKQAT